MAYKMFAAIAVGSSELTLKIYQINARKSFKQIDSISRILELGKDTYLNGVVSTESVNAICDTLSDFKEKMKEYAATEYRAYAFSAIREADNSEIILESIKRRTGISVRILSNSEQRYMSFKGLVASYKDFNQVLSKNTAFIEVGAGSVQISLFDKNNLTVTENIQIGMIRIREYLSMYGNKSGKLDNLISEYVENDIAAFRNLYLNDKEIKNIITVGENVDTLKKIAPDLRYEEKISRAGFADIYNKIVTMNAAELSDKYGIPYEKATLILPSIIIYESFLNNSKAEEIFTPNVGFCEGIVASYMDEGQRIVFNHNFEEDILASAYNLSRRYKSNKKHIEQVELFALKIFDGIKKEFGLTKQERLQLQIAAILHACGNFINLHDGGETSYFIIANTEIIGLSHKERMEVANIVKYNTKYLPSKDKVLAEIGECNYVTIAKLSAILRLANILDKSHKQKIEDLSINITEDNIIIVAKTYEDISLEAALFKARAEFFEKIFGIKVVLKLRRRV